MLTKIRRQEGKMRIYAANAVLPNGIEPAIIEIADGKISQVRTGNAIDLSNVDVSINSGYLTPGLIDLQLNGAFGIDFMAASKSDWQQILTSLPQTGVTSIYPTVITAPIADLNNWFVENADQVKSYNDRTSVLGFHLEGPFLNPVRRGAHQENWVIAPTEQVVNSVLAAAANNLKIVTLAPEISGAQEAIANLVRHGVKVSVGHSDADAQIVSQAADNGASLITHLFNAQSQIGHRSTGVAGQGLIDSRFTLGLIVDLHHVIAETVKLAFSAAPERVCLVTDAISALGMPPGNYDLAGEKVIVRAGEPPVRADGTLAGSAIQLDQAISNCIKIGIDPYLAISAATKVPARAMGLSDRGELKPGMRADLVWLDESDSVIQTKQTWIAGNEVFAK